MKNILFAYFVVLNTLFFPFRALAQTSKPHYNIKELALPSEVDGMRKQSGSIFYSPSIKGKALIPVHIWGEVRSTGLHFIPIGTNLVNALSFAGGPGNLAILENVRLTTKRDGKLIDLYFDITSGGKEEAREQVLQPGDTIFVQKSTYLQDRSYYTSLIGVIVTVLSGILLYRQVEDN